MAVLAVDLKLPVLGPGMGVVGKGDGVDRRTRLNRGSCLPLLRLDEGHGSKGRYAASGRK